MKSDSKKIPACISYLVAIGCFFLPFVKMSCTTPEGKMEFEISAFALATGTAGDSIGKELGKDSGMGGMGMPGGGQTQNDISIPLLLAMIVLGLGLLLGLGSGSGAIKAAAILGGVAALLTVIGMPSAKPGMEGMLEISMRIGFYGILVGSLGGCILHWMRPKGTT